MKYIIIISLLIMSLVFISGCTSSPEAQGTRIGSPKTSAYGTFQEFNYTLDNGTTIHCLINSGQGYGAWSGLSCDW